MPFLAIKTTSSKTRKIDIFSKGSTHGFGPIMAIFPTFFLGSIGKENVFCDILEQKNAFLGYKNKKFKSRKIDIFPKGLTHGFGPKMAIFPTFFLGNKGKENVFYDILHQKSAFLGYKNKNFVKSKNCIFLRGQRMVLVQKWPFFQLFFFRPYWPGECFLRYSGKENCLSRL